MKQHWFDSTRLDNFPSCRFIRIGISDLRLLLDRHSGDGGDCDENPLRNYSPSGASNSAGRRGAHHRPRVGPKRFKGSRGNLLTTGEAVFSRVIRGVS